MSDIIGGQIISTRVLSGALVGQDNVSSTLTNTLAPGPIGATGATGPIGSTGSTGIQGPQGPPGIYTIGNGLSLIEDELSLLDESYTSEEKIKLAGIQAGAEVNVNADWNATSGDARILNKPSLGSAAAANVSDFASAAQGLLADSALQPEAVNYLGVYNNGADYSPGDVVTYDGTLYIRVGEPNPGYPPGTSYWTVFEPEIGSPAYDLWIPSALGGKASLRHEHGNITSVGAIGTVQGRPIITGTDGVLEAGSFGDSPGSFAEGNDPRLSDQRTPLPDSVSNDRLVSGSVSGDKIAAETITNTNISPSAGIVDTKLATISSAGKVSNSATSATSSNTAGSIVSRDSSGGFSAGVISADLSGNATSATTASKVANALSVGNGLTFVSGTSYDGSATRTLQVGNTVVTTTGNQSIGGTKTFTQNTSFSAGAVFGGTATAVFNSAARFEGNIIFNTWPTLPSGEPSSSRHAVPKSYVDAVAQGLHVHAPVHAVTTGSLQDLTGGTIDYINGTDGVGATLELSGSPSANFLSSSVWDGDDDIEAGERVLVKNQSDRSHNGIYVILSSTVLTRASDFDTPVEMAGGDFLFVTHGDTYGDTGWVLSEKVESVGTDPVEFVQFSGAGTYSAGSGLALDGSVFSHADTSSVANLSSNNSGNTFIQDLSLTFDGYGHVTGATVSTGTVESYSGWIFGVDGGVPTTSVSSSQRISFQSGSGLTVDQPAPPVGYDYAIRVQHDASGVSPGTYGQLDGEDGVYIKSITVDSNGHISAISTEDFDDRYQAANADLSTFTLLSKNTGNFIVGNGSSWTVKSGGDARDSLGLGSISTQNANSVNITGGTISTVVLSSSTIDGGVF
jgi:hypothetical protein